MGRAALVWGIVFVTGIGTTVALAAIFAGAGGDADKVPRWAPLVVGPVVGIGATYLALRWTA